MLRGLVLFFSSASQISKQALKFSVIANAKSYPEGQNEQQYTRTYEQASQDLIGALKVRKIKRVGKMLRKLTWFESLRPETTDNH
jgi:hypothetical protein